MKRERPWKKFARVQRVEYRSGDVKFMTFTGQPGSTIDPVPRASFESLDAALDDLDAWWKTFWPAQVRSRRRA